MLKVGAFVFRVFLAGFFSEPGGNGRPRFSSGGSDAPQGASFCSLLVAAPRVSAALLDRAVPSIQVWGGVGIPHASSLGRGGDCISGTTGFLLLQSLESHQDVKVSFTVFFVVIISLSCFCSFLPLFCGVFMAKPRHMVAQSKFIMYYLNKPTLWPLTVGMFFLITKQPYLLKLL